MCDENLIQSHIQMPRCALKQFEINNKLAYYNVREQFIGTNGHSKSIYTELGYYSAVTEERLNKEIETPFAEMLRQVKEIDFNAIEFYKPKGFDRAVKRYIDSLLVRSSKMQEELGKTSNFYKWLPEQMRHNLAVEFGLNLTSQRSSVWDFIPTFAINKTSVQFVLPVCGFYECKLYNYISLLLPIMPTLAVVLLEQKAREKFANKNTIAKFYIDEEETVKWLNMKALQKQIGYKEGFVVASDRVFLDTALEALNKSDL